MCKTCRFETPRLAVEEWHSSSCDLSDVVRNMLTARVTEALPEAWRGGYTPERARAWIEERHREGVTLLAVARSSGEPVGLVILFEEDEGNPGGPTIRLGYLLAESAWGQGLASELVRGFVHWCREAGVRSIVGGVERDNVASRRVLEKSGFVCNPGTEDADEQTFELRLGPTRN